MARHAGRIVPLTAEAAAEGYRRIFQEYLRPIRRRNPAKPLLFLEWGVVDSVAAPFEPGDMEFQEFVFSDANGNGVDDGRETQANMYEGLFRAMGDHPELLHGAFFHEQWMASDANWEEYWAHRGGAGRYAESPPRTTCGWRTAPSRRGADTSRIVFPSARGRLLSEATMSKIVRDLGIGAMPRGSVRTSGTGRRNALTRRGRCASWR